MKETEEYSIIVDNVYKTFSVYLDRIYIYTCLKQDNKNNKNILSYFYVNFNNYG